MNRSRSNRAPLWVAALAASLSACATGPRIPVCPNVAAQPKFVSDPSPASVRSGNSQQSSTPL